MRNDVGVVDVFAKPFRKWSRRATTEEERVALLNQGLSFIEVLEVNDQLLAHVSTHIQAAEYMLLTGADNALEWHIDRALDASAEYRDLRALMPRQVPAALESYQGEFSEEDWALADEAINCNGTLLADGQILFHGGLWPVASRTFTTARPFSTSFCPQVALRNAEWDGKAYDAGRVDLMVVTAMQSGTMGYAYGREGTHGNEKEVVFASAAQLTRVRETYVCDISVYKGTSSLRQFSKFVPAFVVEVEIC